MATTQAYELVIPRDTVAWLDACAAERGRNWRAQGIAPTHFGDKTDQLVNDRLGVYGEYAAHHLFGMPFNSSVGADGDVDSVLWGHTVQVRASHAHCRLLIYETLDDFTTDIAVLALVDLPTNTVRIAGWAGRRDFRDEHVMRVVTDGGRAKPTLSVDQLRPPETLVPLLLKHRTRAP